MSDAGPDWAALYEKHRPAMYRVALTVLARKAGPDLANDAVNAAMVSLMERPPENVENWEALLVSTVRRRALDIVGSAAVARGSELGDDHDASDGASEDDVLDRMDLVARARRGILALKPQERYVLEQYLVLERDRAEVAAELNVTPPRVSQIVRKIQGAVRAALEEGG